MTITTTQELLSTQTLLPKKRNWLFHKKSKWGLMERRFYRDMRRHFFPVHYLYRTSQELTEDDWQCSLRRIKRLCQIGVRLHYSSVPSLMACKPAGRICPNCSQTQQRVPRTTLPTNQPNSVAKCNGCGCVALLLAQCDENYPCQTLK